MAAMALSSPLSRTSLLSRKNLLHSSPSPPAILSFSHHILPQRNLGFRICHSQFDGSAGEEPRAIDESFFEIDDVIEDDSDEDESESSIDLLIRFLQSMFKKVSKRVKKASRPILPAAISPQLVSFAVDGILLLASLSIAKAFLEVICTLGGTVFAVILLLRVIWAGISYFQSSGNGFGPGESSFGRTQPVI
ncbi:hypothetical protein SLA2020_156440 [Shorea laevis]